MRHQQQIGFSLIELIVVIVLVGIIAGLLAPVISTNIGAYISAQERSDLLDKIRISLGRLSRELHQASAPLTTASGSSLQFVTTTVGGKYINYTDNTPRIATADCSKTRNQTPSQLERFRINEAIGKLCVLSPDNLAALSASQRNALIIADNIAPISNITQVTSVSSPGAYSGDLWKVDFGSDFTFTSASSSEQHTFSLADYKHRVYLSGSNLVWDRVSASSSGFGSAVSGILLKGVTAFTTSIDRTKGVVSVNLTISEGGESISVSEDMYVRN